jgi:hypothetical protein
VGPSKISNFEVQTLVFFGDKLHKLVHHKKKKKVFWFKILEMIEYISFSHLAKLCSLKDYDFGHEIWGQNAKLF